MQRVDPTAYIAPSAILIGEVALGASSSIWDLTVLRADVSHIIVGDCSNVQDGTVVHPEDGLPCIVGDRVSVGHRAILHGCQIESDCLIGMGAIVLSRVRIGAGSVVGAGTLVPEGMEVPAGSLVLGTPAKIVRPVDQALGDRVAATWRGYVELSRKHRQDAYRRRLPASRATS